MKTNIKIGFIVDIIAGDDKGKIGEVIDILRKPKNTVRVRVKGVKLVTKHTKKGIILVEDWVQVSNVRVHRKKKAVKKEVKKAVAKE